jgi:hypothetical protein
VQFDVIESAAKVAQSSAASNAVSSQVAASESRCESVAHEIRGAAGLTQRQLNPALLATMRDLYREESALLRDLRTKLVAALQREEEARNALAELRNRERSLARAMSAERRKRDAQRQTAESIVADESWLQRSWQERV